MRYGCYGDEKQWPVLGVYQNLGDVSKTGRACTRKIFECLTRTRKIILKNGRGMAVASQKNIYKNIEKIEKIEFETATCQNIKDVGEDKLSVGAQAGLWRRFQAGGCWLLAGGNLAFAHQQARFPGSQAGPRSVSRAPGLGPIRLPGRITGQLRWAL